MITIIDKNTSKVIVATTDDNYQVAENEIVIPELLTTNLIVPYFNQTTRLFYEGATPEEIAESLKADVPQEVQLWRIRTVLKLMSLETTIETALNGLEEPTKTGALYIWNFGTTIERHSQTVLMLQSVLQMTDEQVDEMFITANNIQL